MLILQPVLKGSYTFAFMRPVDRGAGVTSIQQMRTDIFPEVDI